MVSDTLKPPSGQAQTIQWTITAFLRLLAGALAAKFGADAIGGEDLWASIAEGAGALAIAALSIFSSIKARKTLQAQEPPKK